MPGSRRRASVSSSLGGNRHLSSTGRSPSSSGRSVHSVSVAKGRWHTSQSSGRRLSGVPGRTGRMTARWLTTVALAGGLSISGCSGGSANPTHSPASSVSAPRASSSSTSRSPSATSPSYDPRAKPAVDAYMRFTTAAEKTEMHPPNLGQPLRADVDFTKYSFDPIKSAFFGYVTTLNREGQAWRGTPPTPRISVLSVDLTAKPYPTVTLWDCPTPARSWQQYDVKTGRVASTRAGLPSPPYRITAEIIFYKGRWGASKITPESSRTCAV
jgi:hypothetical protein